MLSTPMLILNHACSGTAPVEIFFFRDSGTIRELKLNRPSSDSTNVGAINQRGLCLNTSPAHLPAVTSPGLSLSPRLPPSRLSPPFQPQAVPLRLCLSLPLSGQCLCQVTLTVTRTPGPRSGSESGRRPAAGRPVAALDYPPSCASLVTVTEFPGQALAFLSR